MSAEQFTPNPLESTPEDSQSSIHESLVRTSSTTEGQELNFLINEHADEADKLEETKKTSTIQEEIQTEQPISLAELSRQYLRGEIKLEEYLALEKKLTPRFGTI